MCVCLGRLDDAREPGGLTTAMRLSAGVARLCFEHEAVVLDVWGAHREDVLMSVCACVRRAQDPGKQSADGAAGGLLQRLHKHGTAVSALSPFRHFPKLSSVVSIGSTMRGGCCSRYARMQVVGRRCGMALLSWAAFGVDVGARLRC